MMTKSELEKAVRDGANLNGVNLRGADLSRTNLYGANLSGANLSRTNLRDANLSRANLNGAYMYGAYLSNANLSNADLSNANLIGAYLRGANMGKQWIIQGQTRSDSYAFFLQRLTQDKEPMVKAGCRYFTLAQAQEHWERTRGETPLGLETREIVRAMVNVMHIRGLK